MHVPLCLHCNFLLGNHWCHHLLSLFFVSFVSSTVTKVSRTCSCASSFVTSDLPHYLNFFKPVFNAYFIMMRWSIWLYCSSSAIFRVFCPCSCGCDCCCEFYPLGWGLSWSLVSWFWLGSYQSVLLLCCLYIQIFSPFNSFPIHNIILLLGQVCIPLVVILTQLCHLRRHYSHHRHHCPNFIHQIPHSYGSQVQGGLVKWWIWERCYHQTLLSYLW